MPPGCWASAGAPTSGCCSPRRSPVTSGPRLALEMFVDRAAAGVAAAATSLPALDALVFTGGIGEHAAPIRSRIVARLAVLGLPPLDDVRDAGTDQVLAGGDGQSAVLRIAAREDLVIASAAAALAASPH